MMLISPSLRSRIVHTTHRCSGRLFLVHLRHEDEDLVIVALYGVSSPTSSDDKKFMRAQLANALTQIAQEYKGKPFMVVGDYNAAASPEDRGTGKLLELVFFVFFVWSWCTLTSQVEVFVFHQANKRGLYFTAVRHKPTRSREHKPPTHITTGTPRQKQA